MSTENAAIGNVGGLFKKERHGITTKAILKEVRNKKVVLQCPEREDRYTLPIAEFNKVYTKV